MRRRHTPTRTQCTLTTEINPHAAGIDIGASLHAVAVPPGSDPEGRDVREFGAFTIDLLEVAAYLRRCGVRTVAMESTGVYWIPLFDLLEEQGFAVYLVDPRQLKRAPARKTDVLDCQLLQQWHALGLLSPAFRPPEQICAMRAVMRQRDMLVRTAAEHIQHVQKALTQMNIKLQHVVADVMGKTGQAIIRAILAGERDGEALARLRHGRCKHDEATLAKSLQGTWREEHLFALRHAVELYDTYRRLIVECDTEIERLLRQMTGEVEPIAPLLPGRHRGSFTYDLREHLIRVSGVDLTRIEGIHILTAVTLISEIGTDMSRWPSVKHFTSWLGVCPGISKSGGRVRSSRTKRCANRAATALRVAAQALLRSDSALGAFLRRKAGRMGMPKAITAAAHKLARLVYAMLKHGTDYVVRTQEDYERAYREKVLHNLHRKAKALGFQLVLTSALEPTPHPAQ